MNENTLTLKRPTYLRERPETRKFYALALRLSDAVLSKSHPDIIRALAEHIPEQLQKARNESEVL